MVWQYPINSFRQTFRSATSLKEGGFGPLSEGAAAQAAGGVYFLSRLSLRVAHRVPTVWKTCTSSTSRMTQTIMMFVW